MYTVTKNTKLTSLVLMLIGVVALGYGFIQGAGHHTDEEVTHQVEAFAHDLQLHMVDHNDAHHKAVKMLINLLMIIIVLKRLILRLYFIKLKKNFICILQMRK